MMSLVIFICPENQYLSKYCEAFYNHINFVYNKATRSSTYGSMGAPTPAKKKVALARYPKKKNQPDRLQMLATDPALDRIYKKVITNDCYDFNYYQLLDKELADTDLLVFMTDNKKTKMLPKYIVGKNLPTLIWKFSNIKQENDTKFDLIEKLIRKMLKTS